jgi:predicted nucleic acid-binding protein
MTSSSSPSLERGLDSALVVYSLVQGHPAALPSEQFLRAHSGWFTSPLVLLEASHILTRVYAVAAADATNKLAQFAAGPLVVLDLDAAATLAALHLAEQHGLDLTDAVLLHLAHQHRAPYLATDDQRLAQACRHFGITPQSPINTILAGQIAAWEAGNLAVKGLPRILRRVHEWLGQSHPQAAQDFWSLTGGGTHLP